MDVRASLKDAAYVGIGFGVLAFQKAQVQRQELKKQLESGLGDAKGGFGSLGTTLEDRVKLVEERLEAMGKQGEQLAEELETRIEKALDEVQERLPEQAREVFGQVRGAAKDARAQVRSLVRANGTTNTAAA